VKLGGSLTSSPFLRDWLKAVGGGGGRLVVVPGGGPFADAVRAAQAARGFDDAIAHRMALLAMEQHAWMLAGLCASLAPVASREEILAALDAAAVPIWLPSRTALEQSDIEASWDVTSDSLAAWLARDVRASLLLLVKAVTVPEPRAAVALARDGIVDRAFPAYHARCGCECRILGASEHGTLAAALRNGGAPGTRVLPGEG
jgi:dihydroneopterin aldolase